jgi:integrase
LGVAPKARGIHRGIPVTVLSYRRATATAQGHIEKLPGGSYRVHVYAGRDPVTGMKRYLRRTVPTEAKAARELANLLADADAGRAPEVGATLGMALDRYLAVADLGV